MTDPLGLMEWELYVLQTSLENKQVLCQQTFPYWGIKWELYKDKLIPMATLTTFHQKITYTIKGFSVILNNEKLMKCKTFAFCKVSQPGSLNEIFTQPDSIWQHFLIDFFFFFNGFWPRLKPQIHPLHCVSTLHPAHMSWVYVFAIHFANSSSNQLHQPVRLLLGLLKISLSPLFYKVYLTRVLIQLRTEIQLYCFLVVKKEKGHILFR